MSEMGRLVQSAPSLTPRSASQRATGAWTGLHGASTYHILIEVVC